MESTSDKRPPAKKNLFRVNKRQFIKFAAIFLLVGAAVAAAVLLKTGFFSDVAFTVDGTPVTKQRLKKFEDAYIKAENIAKNEDTEKRGKLRAKDEITLNILLHNDAKKLNKDVSRADVDEFLSPDFSEHGGKEGYMAYMNTKAGWDEEVVYLTKENVLLKQRLENDNLKRYTLTAVFVRWDNMGYPSVRPDKEEFEAKAKAKLEEVFEPMFKSGASRDEIKKKADLNDLTPLPDVDRMLTDRKGLYTAYHEYNNIGRDFEFAEYPEGESNWSHIERLAKSGDSSPVFRSSTGYWVIYRLEAVNAGTYIDWDDYLTQSKKTRVKSAYKVTKPNLDRVASNFNDLMKTPRAEAEHGSAGGCWSSHLLTYRVAFEDWDFGTALTGAGVRIRRSTVDDCSKITAGNYYTFSDGGTIQAYYDSSFSTGQGNYSSGRWTLHLNCNGSHWLWRFEAPSGYNNVSYSEDGHFIVNGSSSPANGNNPGRSTSTSWGSTAWAPNGYGNSNGESFTVDIRFKIVNDPPAARYETPAHGTVYNYDPGTIISVNGSTGLNTSRTDPDGDFVNTAFRIGSGSYSGAWTQFYADDSRVLQFTTDSTDTSWSYRWNTSGSWIAGDGGSLNGRSFYWNCDSQDSRGLGGSGCSTNNANECNNQASCNYGSAWRFSFNKNIVAQPDLTARNLTGPATVQAGTSATYTGEIYNAGNASAGTSRGRFCVDNPSCLTSTTGTLGERDINSLASGASMTGLTSNSWTPTQAQVGAHTIYWCADVNSAVTESNEGNNCTSFGVNVTSQPDSLPTLSLTASCSNRNVHVVVSDPNGGTSTVYFKIDNLPPPYDRSETDNEFDIPMSGYTQWTAHTVYAMTRGITPSGTEGATEVTRQVQYGPCESPPRNFTVSSTAQPPELDDRENPSTASFNASVSVFVVGGTQSVNTNVNRTFFIRHSNGSITNFTPITVGPPQTTRTLSPTHTISLPALSAGDQVCQNIQADSGSGTVDDNGNIVTSNGPEAAKDPACTRVVALPYLKVFRGSVAAGSQIRVSNVCSSSGSGQISAHSRYNGGQPYGASAEYMAQARGPISASDSLRLGFYSASQRSNAGTYLTVANRGASPPGNWGGNLGAGRCVADLYTTTRTTTVSEDNDININDLTSNRQYQINGNTIIRNSAPATPLNKRVTIYVNGHVMIANDINYITSYDPSNPENVPYITVIALGNIYIDSSVHNIAGLYVAQPIDSTAGGAIFTCGTGGSSPTPVSSSQISGACGGSGLIVRGAFIARKIHFHRSNGTLRSAASIPFPENASSANIAEKFHLAPELYLGQPLFRAVIPEGGADLGEADAHANAPPIF